MWFIRGNKKWKWNFSGEISGKAATWKKKKTGG
jgi:hypothetical protein